LPVGTAFHERTFALCQSLNYRDWSGFYAVSVYETHHEHEYNAIRNASALIDITPLFKYVISGRDATSFVNRVITRDIRKVSVNHVIYCCWCDEEGKIIDDGTITRLEENRYRWTAADPNFRWLRQNAIGFDVEIEDVTEQLAALALQGPTSAALLKSLAEADITNLKYFRKTSGKIAGVPVDVSRTGYTGDLGYEIWVSWQQALQVWDALMSAGQSFDLHATGMLALDVARIEAGLILTDVDYISSKKALTPAQKYTPIEVGLGKLVHLEKESFIGRDALLSEKKHGPQRLLVGLKVDWNQIEALFDKAGLAPQISPVASRLHVPVYDGSKQVGRATSTAWSPLLKQLIALGSVEPRFAQTGTKLQMEVTVEAVRHRADAEVQPLPFFNPPRKTTTPV
jgi:aminomethyltransferase